MTGISRSEGYRRAAGKEAPAVALCADLLRQVFDLETCEIEGHANRTQGDLLVKDEDWSIEVKGQPVSHERYMRNFVEVMEDTTSTRRTHHRDGFVRTSSILRMDPLSLADATIKSTRKDKSTARVGFIAYASPSLEAFVRVRLVVYVNVEEERAYMYGSGTLLRLIRESIRTSGFVRGAGGSNRDTISVFVPHARARWQRFGQRWEYQGAEGLDLDAVRAAIRGPG